MVDLKQAIEHLAQMCNSEENATAMDFTLAAARRELERQEKERPKRASLAEIENRLAAVGTVISKPCCGSQGSVCCDKGCELMHQAADILKALREKVLPWLKIHAGCGAQVEDVTSSSFRDILRALGEDGT